MSARTWLIIALAAVVYLIGNGRIALWDRDEPRYALASRHMLTSGDWMVPRVGWGVDPDRPRTAKPVGIYWAQAAAMAVVGEGSFGARLPSAAAMTLLLILVGVLIGRACGHEVAFWTVLVLASSGMVIVAAKMCVIDANLLLFIIGAQAGVFALWRGQRQWWIAVAVGFCIGIAALLKGPVVLGVIGTTLIALAALGRLPRVRADDPQGGRIIGWKPVLLIFLVTAAMVVPWMLLVERRSPGFIWTAWRHDVATRIAEPLEGHSGPPGFYLLSIWGTFFPWSFLLVTAMVIAWRNLADPRVRFALAAAIGPWLMMELVQTKLVHYILPVFGPLAFLVGDMLARGMRGEFDDLRRRGAGVAGILFAAVAVALTAVPWLAGRWFPIPLSATIALGVVGLCWGVAVMISFLRRRPARAAVSMGVGMLALCGVAAGWYLPRADYLRLSPRIAAVLNPVRAVHPGRVLMLGQGREGYKEQSLAFYVGRDLADEPVNIDTARYIVTSPDLAAALQREGFTRELGRVSGWNYANGRRLTLVIVARQ